MRKVYYILFTFLHVSVLQAQQTLRGTVYRDAAKKQPVASVLIYLGSGAYTHSNDSGAYKIYVPWEDTLRVFHKNKILSFWLPQSLLSEGNFDIYLDDSINARVSVNQLTPVFIQKRNYREDSINNRKEYADVFNYRKPRLSMGDNKWHDSTGGMALDTKDKKLGLLNLNSAIRTLIPSKEDRQKANMQKRLVETEQSNYVTHVFTPALVEKYGVMHNDDSIHLFIGKYAPPYNQLVDMNELDMAMYIIKQVKVFRAAK